MAKHGLITKVVAGCKDLQAPPVLEIEPDTFLDPALVRALQDEGLFVARIDDAPVSTKDDLLQALFDACNFPDWFGFNWDALADSLRDFHWLPAPVKGYVLLFERPNSLNDSDLETFLEIIKVDSEFWAEMGNTPFKLIIPKGQI